MFKKKKGRQIYTYKRGIYRKGLPSHLQNWNVKNKNI